MPDLWFDMDGVAVDFSGHFTALSGKYWALGWEDNSENWDLLNTYTNFFLEAPMAPGFLELWQWARQFNPGILSTESVRITTGLCRQHKLQWVDENLDLTGPKVVIVADWKDKPLHCMPGAILVDDQLKHKSRWEAAGGIFVLFESPAQVKRDLQRLLKPTYAAADCKVCAGTGVIKHVHSQLGIAYCPTDQGGFPECTDEVCWCVPWYRGGPAIDGLILLLVWVLIIAVCLLIK